MWQPRGGTGGGLRMRAGAKEAPGVMWGLLNSNGNNFTELMNTHAGPSTGAGTTSALQRCSHCRPRITNQPRILNFTNLLRASEAGLPLKATRTPFLRRAIPRIRRLRSPGPLRSPLLAHDESTHIAHMPMSAALVSEEAP